jgi:KaiC/GvpD/RAD55 family RecA-like ATPase
MEFNSRTEFAIFFYTLHHPDLINKCQKDFFSDDTTKGLYEISAPFVTKYKKCPSAEEVKQLIANSDWTPAQRDKINDEIVDLLWADCETYKTIYDQTWMKNQVEAFYRYQTLMSGVRQTISFVKLNTENFTIENCKEMTDKVQNMFVKKTSVDIDDDNDKINDAYMYNTYKHVSRKHFSTCDKFLDEMSGGGYWPGSLWVFLGAPKSGKSRWLQNLAVNSSKTGANSAYVSLEIEMDMITSRTGANIYDIDVNKFNNDEFVDNELPKIIDSYTASHPDNGALSLSYYPGSTITVDSLEQKLLKKEKEYSELKGKEFHFQTIFVDYINIMSSYKYRNSENTYLKIKEISEHLREIAAKNCWCIITATQSKLSAYDDSTISISACSESSGLLATADMFFGIISNDSMKYQHCQYLKTLLTRGSSYQNVKQKYIIDESHMRLVKADEPMIFENGLSEKNTKSGYRQSKSRASKTIPKITTNTINPLPGQNGSVRLGSLKIK